VKLTIHIHLVQRLRLWNYISTSPYSFIVWCLVRHRDNFNFTFSIKYCLVFLACHHKMSSYFLTEYKLGPIY